MFNLPPNDFLYPYYTFNSKDKNLRRAGLYAKEIISKEHFQIALKMIARENHPLERMALIPTKEVVSHLEESKIPWLISSYTLYLPKEKDFLLNFPLPYI